MLAAAGRVVAVSGAGRGIGAAIARRLHADGFILALGVRDPEAVSKRLGMPDRVTCHAFDALQPPSARHWIDAAIAAHGRLDGLVNNAGILRPYGLESGDDADLDAMWTVNVKAPLHALRAALPHLRASGHGRVVNIASTDGKRIRDATAPLGYAMTKHALLAVSQAAKQAAWDAGVRVTALCPGAVATELIAGLPGATPPAGRLEPETVAELVSLLLRLPDAATVAELVVNTRLEPTL